MRGSRSKFRSGDSKSGLGGIIKIVGAETLIRKRTVLWTAIAAALAAGGIVVFLRLPTLRPRFTTLQGAVIRSDPNPQHQEPIAGARVTAMSGSLVASAQSDASGYFRIIFPELIWPGRTVTLTFAQPDYHTLQMDLKFQFRSSARQLIVAEMKPLYPQAQPLPGKAAHVISDVRIRYTENSESEQNVGSEARTFQVVNQGNVPCRHRGPCSPDGNWKANTATIKLDAGQGNTFRDVRASCIAGPCPFTRISTHGSVRDGRTIEVSALNWSNTATFLVEAEVFRTSLISSVRESYPVIFDRNISFTLPGSQEGASIEAEVDGSPMLFPLGPDIYLDWATCTYRTNRTKSIVYQCELKPDYRF